MMDANTTTTTGTSIEDAGVPDADVLALLEELDVNEGSGEEAIEEIVEDEILEAVAEITEAEEPAIEEMTLNEDEERALEADLTKAEAYEEQESEVGEVDVEAAVEAAAAPPKEKKARAPKAPKAERNLEALSADNFVLSLADVPADLEANKIAVLSRRPVQKKIAEKFENVFLAIAAGKAPSRYTVDAYKALKAKGTLTSTELVAAFKAAKLGEGTARSQAGQIMALFATLEVAKREGQKLTLNPDSTVAAALDTLIAS